jgi:hypothetical protein
MQSLIFKLNLTYLNLNPISILNFMIRSELIANYKEINLDISYNTEGLRI